MPLFQIKPGAFSLDLLAHKGPNPASYSVWVHACASAGDFVTAFNTVHDMELAFSNLQDSKGLELLSPCSSLWPLVLAIAQVGPGALDVVSKSIA
jgi:pentatricopeptide repeat protein